jgi:hypothetical protein
MSRSCNREKKEEEKEREEISTTQNANVTAGIARSSSRSMRNVSTSVLFVVFVMKGN